ncbi:MAG TPA: acylglycerol kinase family protein, partial [Candidatus Melainabacteria bacterium]|nr:acylglycerol kinase family protein [Candidatus Melainabacteria bacterium]
METGKVNKVCVVYSENAGQFESYRIELANITTRLSKTMNALVQRVELESIEKISLDEFDAVFVMGGDGSVGRTLGKVALEKRRVPVGIIPGGTGNIFAECLGLIKEDRANLIEYALDVIEAKRMATVDIGMANGTPFVIDVGL